MSLIDRVAAAMYEAPAPDDEPGTPVTEWPPAHPEDLAWWITRAQAAIDAVGIPKPQGEPSDAQVGSAPLRYTLAATCAVKAYPLVSSAPFRWAFEEGWAELAERVEQVINDPKYSNDIEWVRMNIRSALRAASQAKGAES
ncbi:hypothetical protein [Microbacterium sp. LWH11-1.2]|uniref:hypothetical protein n=1 Tax=Microbacterium sp. LWH11-1.2 TaxID=3135258 RepID=UPI0031390C63